MTREREVTECQHPFSQTTHLLCEKCDVVICEICKPVCPKDLIQTDQCWMWIWDFKAAVREALE